MAHTFEHTLDEWAKNGTKSAPSSTLKSTGFVGGMKPPASVFNYQWDKIAKAITELQQYALTEDPSGGIWQQLAAVATSGSYNDLLNKPEFKAVATSGSYNDLLNKPNLKAVATSGSYNDLIDPPVAAGSYVGDGTGTAHFRFNSYSSITYVNSSPRQIEFPFSPNVVLLIQKNLSKIYVIRTGVTENAYFRGIVDNGWMVCTTPINMYKLSGNKLSLINTADETSGKSVTSVMFSATSPENGTEIYDDAVRFNRSGNTYYYLAF